MNQYMKKIALLLILITAQSADAFNWKFSPSSWKVTERIKSFIPAINKTNFKKLLTKKSAVICVVTGFALYGFSHLFRSKKSLKKTKPKQSAEKLPVNQKDNSQSVATNGGISIDLSEPPPPKKLQLKVRLLPNSETSKKLLLLQTPTKVSTQGNLHKEPPRKPQKSLASIFDDSEFDNPFNDSKSLDNNIDIKQLLNGLAEDWLSQKSTNDENNFDLINPLEDE